MLQESQTVDVTAEIPVSPETAIQQIVSTVQARPSGPVDASRADLISDGAVSVVHVVRSHVSSGTYCASCPFAALGGVVVGLGVAQGFDLGLMLLGALLAGGAFGSVVMFKGVDGAKVTVAGEPGRSFVSIDGSIDPGLLQSLNMALATPHGVSLLGA
ncbi:hypothetical protein AAK967_01765 [Atopobiaceae bacterium 24-176]